MKEKKQKKSEITLETIAVAALLLIVLFLLVYFFSRSFGNEAQNTNNRFECLNKDSDGDGVNDLIDKCCGTTKGQSVGLDGCAEDQAKTPCDC